ncbi:amidohydrolase family protein [Streptomyces sp. NPDC014991]|uniref:amidohydrolase family protein n=1 Tax=Streptomyces sp. NPDC014991 TaxID=3364935 RepID=UPI0036F7E40D
MSGSDCPVCTPVRPYGEVHRLTRELTAELGEAERTALFGGTARRVYGLRTAPASRVGGRYSRTYVRSQHAPVSRHSRRLV